MSSEPFLDLSLPLPQPWLALPEQRQRSGSGGGREAGDGGGRADCTGAAATSCRKGLLGRSLGADQVRGRHKRKPVDEPCFVPFVSPVPLTPPPAAATVMHGWSGHAMGQRACPSSNGAAAFGWVTVEAAMGAGVGGARAAPPPSGSSSDLCIAPPANALPSTAAATVAGVAAGAKGGPQSQPGRGAGNVGAGHGASTSSTSSNCSSQQAAVSAGGADTDAPHQQAPLSRTAGGAVTRAKARRLCDPGGLTEQLRVVTGAGAGAGVGSSGQQQGQGQGAAVLSQAQDTLQAQADIQGAAAVAAAALASMDVDARALATCKGQPGVAQPMAPLPIAQYVPMAAGNAAAGTRPVAAVSEGSSQRLCGPSGRMWVGTPPMDCMLDSRPAAAAAAAPVGASGDAHLASCMAEFFGKEVINWDCPRDSASQPSASVGRLAVANGAAGAGQLSRSAPAAGAMPLRQPRRGAASPAHGLPGPSAPGHVVPQPRVCALDPGSGRPPRSRGSSRTRPPLPEPGPAAVHRPVSRTSSLERGAAGEAGQQLGVFVMDDVGGSQGGAAAVRRRSRRPSAGAGGSAGGSVGGAADRRAQQEMPAATGQGALAGSWQPTSAATTAAGVVSTRSSARLNAAAAIPVPPRPVPGSGAGGSGAAPVRTCMAHHATKSYRLDVLPPVLLLHLKRFRRDDSGAMRKVGVHIGFDFVVNIAMHGAVAPDPTLHAPQSLAPQSAPALQQLDGKPAPGLKGEPCVLVDHGSMPTRGQGTLDHALAVAMPPVAMAAAAAHTSHTRRYDLVGVVEHIGSLKSGHYVAYVSRRSKAEPGQQAGPGVGAGPGGDEEPAASQWYCVSDTSVKPVSREQVLRAQAYVLMYVQRPCLA